MQRFGTLVACQADGGKVEVCIRLEYPAPWDKDALSRLIGQSVLVAIDDAYRGCPGCGAGFIPRRGNQRHCSEKCRQRARYRRGEEPETASEAAR